MIHFHAGTIANRETLAKFSCAYAGVIFGLYWIPLRSLDDAGFSGPWAVVTLLALPFLIVTPVYLGRHIWRAPFWQISDAGSFFMGLAFALYSIAFLFTTILNVIVLFYLMPLWGFIFSRLVAGERISPIRSASIAIGLIGVSLIVWDGSQTIEFGGIGDILALFSGISWAIGSTIASIDRDGKLVDYGFGFLFWAGLMAAVAAVLISHDQDLLLPEVAMIIGLLYWLIPLALLGILPGAFATVYGPTVLNPGVAGLLFMTEISVGAATAAAWANEPIGIHQFLGIAAVTLAGVLESTGGQIRAKLREYRDKWQ